MSTINAKLARLTPEQMKVLASRLGAKAAAGRPIGGIAAPRIPHQERGDAGYKLSFSQQRLWFLCQLDPDSAAYNTPIAVRLQLAPPHNFDPDLVKEAVAVLVKRHETLRTVFAVEDGNPVQCIRPTMTVPVVVHDMSADDAAGRENAAIARLREDAGTAFDLAEGPLLRVTVVRLADFDWMLQINSHHLISDAWSLGVLLREINFVLGARKMGKPPLLPVLPAQYVDYAAWERQKLEGPGADRLRIYWEGKLGGTLPVLDLPFSRRAPHAGDARRGAVLVSSLEPALTAQVTAFARAQSTTPFNVLLAAFKLLLRRYTRSDDVIVGTPVANRAVAEVEGLIGCFINTLALRTDLEDVGDFRDALDRVSATTSGALSHGEFPFELLVRALRTSRDARHPPIFQTMFTLQNAPIATDIPGGRMQILDVGTGDAKFDLSLAAHEFEGAFALTWSFRADLIERASIAAMAAHYRTLLQAILAAPDLSVDHHALLDQAGRAQTLALLAPYDHAAEPAVSDPPGFDLLFDEAALRSPDAVAVEGDGTALSYGALRRRANALAHRLAADAPADAVIAVLMPRSPLAVLGLLAVLKACRAFVPLDPSWPAERIATVLGQAGASRALVAPGLEGLLPSGCLPVVLDDCPADEADQPPALSRHPADLAYVIFTSGTSGVPKGVAVEHRQLLRYIRDVSDRMALPPGSRFATVSTQAADLGHTMIFPALASGGTLMIASDRLLDDPEALASWFEASPADALKIVPSHLAGLLEVERPARMLPRRLLVLGGEAMPASLPERVAATGATCRILNHYGPTETTVGVITGPVGVNNPADGSEACRGTVLGRPLDGARVYICDEALNLQPPGIPGELCIGGLTVARGYLGRPDLTAWQFSPDPAAVQPGARLYRSGDLARLLPSGEIEFLGRIDDQVKIRGFRIEPAEVEAVARRCPGVHAVAVKPVTTRSGETALALWAAVGATASLQPDAVREPLMQLLRASLQAAAVPAFVTLVADLPRTPNGKIDRAALHADPEADAGQRAAFVAPRSSLELGLARLWEELLDQQPVGVDDDFFALGGHSLLAVRLVALMQRRFGVAMPLASLFSHPTVAGLARLVQAGAVARSSRTVVPIQVTGDRPPLFFVHPAGGNVLCYYDLGRALGATQPLYGLQASVIDEDGGEETIAGMAARYVAALRAVQPRGPYQLGGWSMGGLIAYEMASQLVAAGETIGLIAIVDQPAPGGITRTDRERIDDATALGIYVRKLELFTGSNLGLTSETFRTLSEAERLDVLLASMRQARLVPDEIDTGQLRNFVAMQKAHNLATLSYAPPRFAGTVTLIRGSDPFAVREEAELLGLEGLYEDPSLGWQRHAATVRITVVPGNHVTMMTPPFVARVASTLSEQLGSTQNHPVEVAA